MNVRELIARLRKMPQEIEVKTEGCDCEGDAYGVEEKTYGSTKYVLITRR